MIGNRIRRLVLPARPGARRREPAEILREVSDLESARLGLPAGSIVLVRHLVKRSAWPDLRTRAARPALEPFVPEQVEAVWFLDEPELVACLLRDAACRNLSHWWWRLAFPGGPTPSSVVRVLGENPGVARVATGRVRRAGLDQELWSWLGGSLACAVRERISSDAIEQARRTSPDPERPVSPGATDSVLDRLRPEGRSAESATAAVDGIGSEAGPGVAELRGGPCPAAGQGTEAVRKAVGAGSSRPAGSSSDPSATRMERVEHGSSPALGNEPVSPSPLGKDNSETGERGGTAPEGPLGSATRAETWIAQERSESRSEAVSTVQEDPEPVRSSDAPRREAQASTIWASAESQVVTTRFGGIFFVLNAAIALGWLPDFTRPSDPGAIGNPWGYLGRIGSRRFGRRFEADPIHGILRGLLLESGDGSLEDPESDSVMDRFVADALEMGSRRAWFHLGLRKAWIRDDGARLDVGFRLDEHSMRIRCAGLDRDPGWISSGGRDVRFVFDAGGAA